MFPILVIPPIAAVPDIAVATATQYRVSESQSTSERIPRMDVWLTGGRYVMLSPTRFDFLESDFLEYLEHEAQRRGISIQDVHKEEMAAQAELSKITPRNDELLLMAERFPAPQEWYDE